MEDSRTLTGRARIRWPRRESWRPRDAPISRSRSIPPPQLPPNPLSAADQLYDEQQRPLDYLRRNPDAHGCIWDIKRGADLRGDLCDRMLGIN